MLTPALARQLNALGLLAISAALAFAYYDQFFGGDLPCPLCLLQRVALTAVGFGLLMNVVHGPRPRHYGFMLLAACFGAAVASRQVLLHIVPGTGSYGAPFLGLHFYTWALVLFCLVILGSAILLLMDRQFERTETAPGRFSALPVLDKVAVSAIIVLAAANTVTTFAECGPIECADDPTNYWILGGEPLPAAAR